MASIDSLDEVNDMSGVAIACQIFKPDHVADKIAFRARFLIPNGDFQSFFNKIRFKTKIIISTPEIPKISFQVLKQWSVACFCNDELCGEDLIALCDITKPVPPNLSFVPPGGIARLRQIMAEIATRAANVGEEEQGGDEEEEVEEKVHEQNFG